MVKTNIQEFVYEYTWETVVESYFRRFPLHKRMPVLLGTEVLEDTYDPVTKIRHIQRRCTLDVEAPKYGFSCFFVHVLTPAAECSR